MRSLRDVVRAAALVAAIGGAAAGAAAQTESDAWADFGESLEVRVVNVEAVVEDWRGRRVDGLTAGDFRLFVDGEEVPIAFFSEVRGGRIVEGAPAAGTAPAAADAEVGTQVLVFVDDAFALRRDRDRVLARLAEDLGALAPGDRVAVVAFDGRTVEPLLDWSGDRGAIERALAAAAERPAFGLRRRLRLAGGLPLIEAVRDPAELHELELAGDLDRLVAAASASLRAAGRPEGRRVMLLLSGGWPFHPGAVPLDVRFSHLRGTSIAEETYAPLVDAANLLGYTLYPVDVPGFLPSDGIDAEHAAPPRRTALSDHLFGEEAAHRALDHLARETGGRSLLDGRRSEALAAVTADLEQYYWLGFEPAVRDDDSRREIRLEVAGRALRVRARDSYFDLSRASEQALVVEGALLFGGGRAAGGVLDVELGEPEPRNRRVARVPVRVSFPAAVLEAVPSADGLRWRVAGELRVAALDVSSRLSQVPVVPIELELAEPPRAGERLTWEGTLELRRVEQVVAVSLADRVSGRTVTSRLSATP
ncbi:MAG TPA: VWA domain-containing protein [Thermoanaerobaculia bacterium]|nr:VWA domain-containing protein [Thermoanaerobaculia bacterium]